MKAPAPQVSALYVSVCLRMSTPLTGLRGGAGSATEWGGCLIRKRGPDGAMDADCSCSLDGNRGCLEHVHRIQSVPDDGWQKHHDEVEEIGEPAYRRVRIAEWYCVPTLGIEGLHVIGISQLRPKLARSSHR
jgi:hypothetical protein